MSLSANDRGVLETLIDQAINSARNTVKQFGGDEKVRRAFHINHVPDFAFGLAYGQINQGFASYYVAIHRSQPTAEELKDVSDVVLRRMPEIRKAIFFQE